MKKRLREQADFDQAQYTPDALHTFDKQEFSDRGRADIKTRPNDPRFADNPMADKRQMLSEFEGQSEIDRLHDILNRADISDQQIRGGVKLTHRGKEKVAGELGIGPDDVDMYINSLVQQLRDEDESSMDSLAEQYYNAVNVIDEDEDAEEAGQPKPPFPSHKRKKMPEGRYSYEPDALGSVTVRDAQTGKSSFVQGAAASRLLAQLKGGNEDAILAPLVEELHDAPSGDDDDFWGEIKADTGTFNFLWQYHGQHGSGTVMFSAKGAPKMQLVDVRDAAGNEIEVDPMMQQALQQQAHDFIGKE